MESTADFPLLLQEPLSLVGLWHADLEAVALRSALECFNYRVETHWIGSRPQFMEILCGHIPTFRYVVLSCHGDENGILVPDQKPVTAHDLAQTVHLTGRVVVSTGCRTGTEAIASAFLNGGCDAYIAPTGDIDGNASLLFAIHLFYFLAGKQPLADAGGAARGFDAESGLFRLYAAGTPPK